MPLSSVPKEHPVAPAFQVVFGAGPASKGGGEDQEQKKEREQERNGRAPVPPPNQISNDGDGERLDRRGEREESARAPGTFRAQGEEAGQEQGEQEQSRLPEKITAPDVGDDNKIGGEIEKGVRAFSRRSR